VNAQKTKESKVQKTAPKGLRTKDNSAWNRTNDNNTRRINYKAQKKFKLQKMKTRFYKRKNKKTLQKTRKNQ